MPAPIGSGLPFAMASAFARALGSQDTEETGPRKRGSSVLLIGAIGAGALMLAYLIVVSLDRPADLRSGLVIVVLFGFFAGVIHLVGRIRGRQRAGSADRP